MEPKHVVRKCRYRFVWTDEVALECALKYLGYQDCFAGYQNIENRARYLLDQEIGEKIFKRNESVVRDWMNEPSETLIEYKHSYEGYVTLLGEKLNFFENDCQGILEKKPDCSQRAFASWIVDIHIGYLIFHKNKVTKYLANITWWLDVRTAKSRIQLMWVKMLISEKFLVKMPKKCDVYHWRNLPDDYHNPKVFLKFANSLRGHNHQIVLHPKERLYTVANIDLKI